MIRHIDIIPYPASVQGQLGVLLSRAVKILLLPEVGVKKLLPGGAVEVLLRC